MRCIDEDKFIRMVESPSEIEDMLELPEIPESMHTNWWTPRYNTTSRPRPQEGVFDWSPIQMLDLVNEDPEAGLPHGHSLMASRPDNGMGRLQISGNTDEESEHLMTTISPVISNDEFYHYECLVNNFPVVREERNKTEKCGVRERLMNPIRMLDEKFDQWLQNSKAKKHAKNEKKNRIEARKRAAHNTNKHMQSQIDSHRERERQRSKSWKAAMRDQRKEEKLREQEMKGARRQNKQIEKETHGKSVSTIVLGTFKIHASITRFKELEPLQVRMAKSKNSAEGFRPRTEAECSGYHIPDNTTWGRGQHGGSTESNL